MRRGCAEGNGSFEFKGRSVAQAEAFALAESFAEGLVTANACGFCDIAADFVADSFEKIVIQAAAEAEAALSGQANGDKVEATADVVTETIVTASTTAYAQVRAPVTVQGPFYCSAIWKQSAKHLTSMHVQMTSWNYSDICPLKN